MSVAVNTAGGFLELGVPLRADQRCGCGTDTDLVGIVSYTSSGQRASLAMCGTCISIGLAIQLGRLHVDQGGAVEDLRADPTEEIPAVDPNEGD